MRTTATDTATSEGVWPFVVRTKPARLSRKAAKHAPRTWMCAACERTFRSAPNVVQRAIQRIAHRLTNCIPETIEEECRASPARAISSALDKTGEISKTETPEDLPEPPRSRPF